MASLKNHPKAVFYEQHGPYGRQTPSTFNFVVEKNDKIRCITISTGSIVDGIGFEIEDQSGESKKVWYGGRGMNTATLRFEDGENITQISGSYGNYGGDAGAINVAQILIHTNLAPNGYGPFGLAAGCTNINSFKSPAGPVVGFFGATGRFVQSIGVSTKTAGKQSTGISKSTLDGDSSRLTCTNYSQSCIIQDS